MKFVEADTGKKTMIGTCVNNPFDNIEELTKVIDNSKDISQKTFLKRCEIAGLRVFDMPLPEALRDFPNDFEFYRYRNIYFFTHSRTEHFFI